MLDVFGVLIISVVLAHTSIMLFFRCRSVRQEKVSEQEQLRRQELREARAKADRDAQEILDQAARALAENEAKTQEQRDTEAREIRKVKKQAEREAADKVARAAQQLVEQEAATKAEREAKAKADFEKAERDRKAREAQHLADEAEANARAEAEAKEKWRLSSIQPAPDVDNFFSMLGM